MKFISVFLLFVNCEAVNTNAAAYQPWAITGKSNNILERI